MMKIKILIEDEPLVEARRVSGIVRFLQKKFPFAIISAYTRDYSEAENKKRMEELKQEIRRRGYGYSLLRGIYTYEDESTGKKETVEEYSYLVPGIKKNEALNLAKKFDQESIIYYDGHTIQMVETDGRITKIRNLDNVDLDTAIKIAAQQFSDYSSKTKKGKLYFKFDLIDFKLDEQITLLTPMSAWALQMDMGGRNVMGKFARVYELIKEDRKR